MGVAWRKQAAVRDDTDAEARRRVSASPGDPPSPVRSGPGCHTHVPEEAVPVTPLGQCWLLAVVASFLCSRTCRSSRRGRAVLTLPVLTCCCPRRGPPREAGEDSVLNCCELQIAAGDVCQFGIWGADVGSQENYRDPG